VALSDLLGEMMRILVLGASGMIGSAVMKVLTENSDFHVFGTIRHESLKRFFSGQIRQQLITGVELATFDLLFRTLGKISPDVIINCAGLTKHKADAGDPLVAVPINSLLPHWLSGFCEFFGARLIHISTDCVFSGDKGGYNENDVPDARDVYGRSKILGEVLCPHAITLRTSTIGHELQTKYGLLDWFLSKQDQCQGYNKAVFSGLPSIFFAKVIRDIVIPNPELSGLYHVSGKPISKYDLLKIIANVYGKSIDIVPNNEVVIDRSLVAERFQLATGFIAPDWPELIESMHSYN
jgi:dTDP-4-dehydrorhamnose reductase